MKYVISWFERPQGSPMEYEKTAWPCRRTSGSWDSISWIYVARLDPEGFEHLQRLRLRDCQ